MTRTFSIYFKERTLPFSIPFKEVTAHIADSYTGSYSVTPSLTSQQIETSGKTMSSNITISAIPVTTTENSSGGYTIVIGGS